MGYSFHAHRITGGIGADDGFWESLEDGGFRLPRCADCAEWMWPAHHRCAVCGCWEQRWEPTPMDGRVYSWTRVHTAVDRAREGAPDLPYVVIVAELPAAAGARVLGRLAGPDQGVRVGARVNGHIDPPSPRTRGYAVVRWSVSW
ncbi:OB-fold domain-containing protein [Pseudonocardia nematodicida]|uniref:OB-fold domain-containing protein n=1 Tax=Pseudonocardia nematodicida TaxID=1206997 RepID=A0ABV1K8I7_9PSEU